MSKQWTGRRGYWARMFRGRVSHIWYQPDPLDAALVTACGLIGNIDKGSVPPARCKQCLSLLAALVESPDMKD